MNDWRPDWRNKEGYPDLDGMTSTQVAWEFLRRNPDYERDYLDTYPRNDDRDQRDEKLYQVELLTNAGEHPEDGYEDVAVFDPPRIAEETSSEWFSRTGEGGVARSKREFYAMRYGISTFNSYLPAPWQEVGAKSLFMFDASRTPIVYEYSDRNWVAENMKPNTVAIVFDLERSIPGQLKKADKSLKRRQEIYAHRAGLKETRIPNNLLLLRYLRILDAVSQGVAHEDIVQVLFPNQDKSKTAFDHNLEEAIWLSESGYKKLVYPKK